MLMLSYAFTCITLSRITSRSLENLRKRVLRWAFNDKSANYHFNLEKAIILLIPMYFQFLNLLLLSCVFHDSEKRKEIITRGEKQNCEIRFAHVQKKENVNQIFA